MRPPACIAEVDEESAEVGAGVGSCCVAVDESSVVNVDAGCSAIDALFEVELERGTSCVGIARDTVAAATAVAR
jgi:hypothetical protein